MSERNYWPHFIIGLVFFAIALGVWTVKNAIDNPVELDNTYMMPYQQVDSKIYDLEKMKREFAKKYDLVILTKKLDYPEATLRFTIRDKNGEAVKNAKVLVLFTRPDTTKHDIKKEATYKEGVYEVHVKLPLQGRWDVILKVEIDKLTVFDKYKMSTLREMLKKA